MLPINNFHATARNKRNQTPLPFRGGVGGGGSPLGASFKDQDMPTPPTPTPWSLSDQSGGLIPPRLKRRGLKPSDTDKRLGRNTSQGRRKDWGISAERLAELHACAAEMRRNPTELQKRLWRYLSNSQVEGHKFRRQAVIGYYIADFACPFANLIVEVDGDTHDGAKDRLRDDKLAEFGWQVLRVTNADVLHNMEGVLVLITRALPEAARPHPNPSPEGEGLQVVHEPMGIALERSVG